MEGGELHVGWRSVLAGQHDHRDLSCDLGLVVVDLGGLGGQLRPQLGPGGFVQLRRHHGERLGAHLDVNAGVGLEVVVPGGVGGGSSVGGDDEEAAVPLGEAAQRGDVLDPRFGADVVDEDQRGALPWSADASVVGPELLDDLGVVVVGDVLSPGWRRLRVGR
jgi:hypothetical protein